MYLPVKMFFRYLYPLLVLIRTTFSCFAIRVSALNRLCAAHCAVPSRVIKIPSNGNSYYLTYGMRYT